MAGVFGWNEMSSLDLGFVSLKYEGRDPLRFRITDGHPVRRVIVVGELQDRQVAAEADQEFVAGRRPDRREARTVPGAFMDRIEGRLQLCDGRNVSNFTTRSDRPPVVVDGHDWSTIPAPT